MTVIGSSHSRPVISLLGNIACGKDEQQRHRDRRADRRDQQRVPDHADVRLVGVRQLLGEPALQAERRQLRRELDDQHRIGEAAERFGAVHPAGDEQERQPRREPQHEAEEIDPPAARQRGEVGGRRRRSSGSGSMRGAPMRAPADLDVERHVELERRLGGVAPSPRGPPRRPPPRGPRALRTPVRHGPGAASARRRARPSASASSIRAIARLMRSALVPWIGALIAARSAPARMVGIGGADVGEMRLAAEQGAGEAMLADEGQRLVDVSADAGEALEIAVDDRLALLARHAQPAGQPPGRNAVEDGEIDRLGLVAGLAVDRSRTIPRRSYCGCRRRRENASFSCGTSAMCAASRSSIWL